MRHLRFRTVIALATIVVVPAFAEAQEPVARPATHTVKKGDTLWDLAKLYLGDPFQWQQIYQLNTDLIKDPHWIYPGQEFKIPGGTVAAAPAAQPAAPVEVPPAAAPPPPADTAAAPPIPVVEPPVAAPPESVQVAPVTEPALPQQSHTPTVFNPRTNAGGAGARPSLLAPPPRTAVRPGDFVAIPYVWAKGGPTGSGRVDATTEALARGVSAELRPIQLMEQVLVTMPAGVEAQAGARLLVYRLGDMEPGGAQVVVPTGVLSVVAPMDGRRARATVVQKYEELHVGDPITRVDTLAMPEGVFPSRVDFGMTTSVTWVYGRPELPSRGDVLILAAGSAQGLVPGDQVTVRADARGAPAGSGLPDTELGVAQVVRVTQWGASAMLLDVNGAGIVAGARARISAKMP